MTVVSTKEFVSNEDKYFDMAMSGQVFVQRDNIMFIVTRVPEKKRNHKKPDDDFRRAITMDEFKERAREVVKTAYKRYTNERNHIAGSS